MSYICQLFFTFFRKGLIHSATLPDTGEAVWECEVTIRHMHGEEVVDWGVRFNLRASDRSLVNGSIMCVGAG
ncbi:MAG TPA: hypothetical protein VKF36_20060 [Syntrophorhabdales bacterium]|nr:hypothetical protein [Syntrophorhabdales bacterium]